MKNILTRIRDEIAKMEKSRDLSYTETYIYYKKDKKTGKEKGFNVECTRIGWEDDEDPDYRGSVCGYEVYYQEDKEDIDCCTLTPWYDPKDLEEFVNMWR